MKKQLSRSIRYVFTFILAVSSFVPMQGSSASRPSEAEFSRGEQDMEPAATAGQASDLHIESGIDHSEYQVIENTDPYLMSLALGTDEPESKYGPKRNLFEEGIPEHAYSPFEEVEKRETCPQGGCDYVEGRVLIKLDAEQVFSKAGTNQVLLQDQELTAALEALEISDLTPVFPNAEPPSPGEMVEAIDGGLVEKPDLTRWLQGETRSTKGMSEVIQQLQKTVGIAVAEPDYIRRPVGEARETVSTSPVALPGPGTDPLFAQQWHLEATNVPEAWAYLESQGLPAGGSSDVIVAVIDTGVDYTHPDLAANMWINQAEFYGSAGSDDDGNGYVDDIYGADTVYPDGDPLDDHGHGTHVAGIIAAQAGNGIGGVGVAYNTRIMAIKAAQYSGILASSDIAEGLYYAVTKGADVINMSFGSYARSTIEEDALTIAFGHAVLVAAAGNDGQLNGPGSLNMFPAAYNWILGVMSRNQYPDVDGNYLSGFSNYDASANDEYEYELMAPGQAIWSTLPGEQYAAWSGTSMSAPVVSGIAALARTKWSDKNIYSSRFIMGQIATTGSSLQGLFELHYNIPDALASITTSPEPKLNYLQHWVFDTQSLDSSNDEDGIVDSGELIDLGIMIRNHWGQTDNVTIRLEPIAESAVLPDPYVTMITDTVVYEPIGSFNWQDNGLIYEGEELVGVEFPFRFTTAPDTPNDHVIPFRLTMTTNNGLDPEDETSYVFEARFYLMVQRGVTLPFIIDSDMTLTNDTYWIVPGATLISDGVTVSISEGAQLQFYSELEEGQNIYDVDSYIQVEGILNIAGSADAPVEIFPGLDWQGFPVSIVNQDMGFTSISYAKIANPKIGRTRNPINHIDHSTFWQEIQCIWQKMFGQWQCSGYPIVYAKTIEKSRFIDLIGLQLFGSFNPQDIKPASGEIARINTSLFNNSTGYLYSPVVNSVFLDNFNDSGYRSSFLPKTTIATNGYLIHEPTFLRSIYPTVFNGKTYALVGRGLDEESDAHFRDVFTFSELLGGYPITVNDQEESDFMNSFGWTEEFSSRYSDMDCGHYDNGYAVDCATLFSGNRVIGLTAKNETCEFQWSNGEPLSYTNWAPYEPSGDPCGKSYVQYSSNYQGWISYWETQGPIVIELPGVITDEQLLDARQLFLDSGSVKNFFNNALLNRWKSDPAEWLHFKMDKGREYVSLIAENYWGGASNTQIDQSILDFNDNFNLGAFIYEPVLTEAPVNTYPFVVDVVLSTDSQSDIEEVGAEEVTFTVLFNRDMNQSIQPTVTFGPAEPYSDFSIAGNWVDTRTWVGSFQVTPVTGNGYQYIRVADAVAADDPWLVIGRDAGRFRFNITISGSASMNLQANGGDGFVELSWTQSDYDLLAGFNVYRSTYSNFEWSYRMNDYVLPPDTRSFFDVNADPGHQYYYRYAIVNTDMTEGGFSNIVIASALDTIPPVLLHTPITDAEPGQPLSFMATVTDNVHVLNTQLYHRHIGDLSYQAEGMLNTTENLFSANLVGTYVTPPGIEYYIEATDGVSIARSGEPGNPHRVVVDDTPVVTNVSPKRGPSTGGATVTITGSNFQVGSEVTFGGSVAVGIVLNSPNQISCITPAHFPGIVDIQVTNPNNNHGTLLNGYTFESDTAKIKLPATGGRQGNVVSVPVNGFDFEGLLAASIDIQYDPEILMAKSASTGTLTAGFGFTANFSSPGLVRLSMSNQSMVSGNGTLALVDFEVTGIPGSTSPLNISSYLLNDGAIQAEIENGTFLIDDVFGVSGVINYYANALPVQGVDLRLVGDALFTGITNPDGSYIVQGAPAGSYVLSADKDNQVNGITAYDASLVLQYDVGLLSLSDPQLLAADVNGSGSVNSMDASYILQHSAGLISSPFPGVGVTWKFIPEERIIANLASNLMGQDFTAILVGDVSASWVPESSKMNEGQTTKTSDAIVSLPEVSVLVNEAFSIPISLEIVQAEVFGVDLEFTYDPNHVQIADVSLNSDISGWIGVINFSMPGIVRVAMAGAEPISEDSDLLNINLSAIGQPNTSSTLHLTSVSLNEGQVTSISLDGVIHIKNIELHLPMILR